MQCTSARRRARSVGSVQNPGIGNPVDHLEGWWGRHRHVIPVPENAPSGTARDPWDCCEDAVAAINAQGARHPSSARYRRNPLPPSAARRHTVAGRDRPSASSRLFLKPPSAPACWHPTCRSRAMAPPAATSTSRWSACSGSPRIRGHRSASSWARRSCSEGSIPRPSSRPTSSKPGTASAVSIWGARARSGQRGHAGQDTPRGLPPQVARDRPGGRQSGPRSRGRVTRPFPREYLGTLSGRRTRPGRLADRAVDSAANLPRLSQLDEGRIRQRASAPVGRRDHRRD